MDGGNQPRGKKRSKAFYRKCAYGAKKHCQGANVLEPGIRGFLIMCNHEERSAVREGYNILNEYADELYGPDKNAGLLIEEAEDDDESDDMESALKKEVEELKRASSSPMKRFQNVNTGTKNVVFIRTSLENPIEVTSCIMKDIAEKHLKKARYAARILPVIGTCKANTKDIEKLACEVLSPVFSNQSAVNCTVLFKIRNNNGTSCGRESVVPSIIKIVNEINPEVKFSWTDFSTAIVVEVVRTVCCIGVAPDYFRLRKYNLQELQQGPKEFTPSSESTEVKTNTVRDTGESHVECGSECKTDAVEQKVAKDDILNGKVETGNGIEEDVLEESKETALGDDNDKQTIADKECADVKDAVNTDTNNSAERSKDEDNK